MMPVLIAVLLKHGYGESDLKKILGENYLRVIREAMGKQTGYGKSTRPLPSHDTYSSNG
jgi:hypothetical protein